MLRILQTSDVHLGARHLSLGERAADQRERQFRAFERSVELAIATPVDLFLIAGDLFETAVEPRSSVERVGSALRKLVQAGIRTVILPGDHDAAGSASIYRAYDIRKLAGAPTDGGLVTFLTVDQPDVEFTALGARVTSRFPATDLPDDGHRIGVIHVATLPRDDEIAAAGVDYLAIGGLHEAATGRAGSVSWSASGTPEVVDVERDRGRSVVIATLDDGPVRPHVERKTVGATRYEHVTVDIASIADQDDLIARLAAKANGDLFLDVIVEGNWPDAIELDAAATEAALAPGFFRVRVRNAAEPIVRPGPLPPADTIAGAFVRGLEGQIAGFEKAGEPEPAREHRRALRLGRRLLDGTGTAR